MVICPCGKLSRGFSDSEVKDQHMKRDGVLPKLQSIKSQGFQIPRFTRSNSPNVAP
jgi:hypothetical protein